MPKENLWWQVENTFEKYGFIKRGKEKWGRNLSREERIEALDWLAKKVKEKEEPDKLYIPMRYDHFGLKFKQWWNYGTRLNPRWVSHPGLDYNLGAPYQDLGNPIYSMADGFVTYIAYSTGFGWHIFVIHKIKHKEFGDIKCWTHYCHLKEKPPLSVGSFVKAGQKIAKCGNTGTSTAPHLHFEIRKRPLGVGFFPYGKTEEWIEDNFYNPLTFIKN